MSSEVESSSAGGPLADEVRGLLAVVLRRSAVEIALDHELEADLGVDSLAMIDLSVSIEERFGIVVPPIASPEDLALRTVRDVVAWVDARREGGAP